MSNRIVINPIIDNSVYTSNSTIDKDKWSKEDDSLELLVVPNADIEFQNDDNHYHSENNTVSPKIIDYFLKTEKSKNSSIKHTEKIKSKNKSRVANELLIVIPNNNKTNNNTTRNINKGQKKNETLQNGLTKINLKDVTKKFSIQIITTVNTRTTPGLALNKNTILFKVNNINTNDNIPKRNIGKNLSNNLITIVTNKSFTEKPNNSPLKTEGKDEDDPDRSSLLNIINKTLRLQAKLTNNELIKSRNNDSINNTTNGDLSKDILLTNTRIIHNVSYANAQRQNIIVNNEVAEPGSNYVYTNMSGEEYSDLLDTITTEGLINRSDLRSVGEHDRKKVVNALNSTLKEETNNKNKTSQPLILVVIINPK